MAIELNHTIVPAHDPQASAQFLADILGVEVGAPVAHFTPVTLANRVTLDFDAHDKVDQHHYAFMVSAEEFDAAALGGTQGVSIYRQSRHLLSRPERTPDGDTDARLAGSM